MTGPLPILMYHSVDDVHAAAYRRWTVPPMLFARHLALLAGDGWHPITISALAEARTGCRTLPPRAIVLTFDDGLRDFLDGALPLLQEHGFQATLFVTTAFVGRTSRWLSPLGEGRRPMLSKEDLREIDAAGIECGGHSATHQELDLLPQASALNEISASKKTLEDCLGKSVTSFAYPHGYSSRTTRRLVKQAGFTAACRVRHALSAEEENPFTLSRLMITPDVDEIGLARLLRGEGVPAAPPPDRLASDVWRVVRRMRRACRRGIAKEAGTLPELAGEEVRT